MAHPSTGRKGVFLLSKSQKGKRSDILEVQILKGEVSLYDACGLHPGAQHILLGGDVVSTGYPLQIVQVAGDKEERCCESWTMGHPHSGPESPVYLPALFSWSGQCQAGMHSRGPMCILGSPHVPARHRAGQDTSGQGDMGHTGLRAECWHWEPGRGCSQGWGAHPVSLAICTGGNGKRKIFSAMATSHSAGGNNRWRHAIYSQKHKGTASWEEAGDGRPERQGAAPWGAANVPSTLGRIACPAALQGPSRDGGQVPSVQHPLGLMRAAGGIKAGFDFSSSHCFNWVTTNGLF